MFGSAIVNWQKLEVLIGIVVLECFDCFYVIVLYVNVALHEFFEVMFGLHSAFAWSILQFTLVICCALRRM